MGFYLQGETRPCSAWHPQHRILLGPAAQQGPCGRKPHLPSAVAGASLALKRDWAEHGPPRAWQAAGLPKPLGRGGGPGGVHTGTWRCGASPQAHNTCCSLGFPARAWERGVPSSRPCCHPSVQPRALDKSHSRQQGNGHRGKCTRHHFPKAVAVCAPPLGGVLSRGPGNWTQALPEVTTVLAQDHPLCPGPRCWARPAEDGLAPGATLRRQGTGLPGPPWAWHPSSGHCSVGLSQPLPGGVVALHVCLPPWTAGC